MRSLAGILSSLALLCSHLVDESTGFSMRPLSSAQQLSQKSVVQNTLTMAVTRREPIRMPNSSPQVPYKPPGQDYTQFIDIEAAMYRDRTMFISRYIDEEAANNIISILLYLRNESPKEKISLYFNVPGAQLRPALAIYDLLWNTRQKCEIETVNLALTAGMGSLLCAAGTPGLRHALPNARFLLQRTGITDSVFQGQATDIALEVKNTKESNDRMEAELSKLTGQPLDRIQQDLKRDFYLSSDEAVQYGLIDSVLLPSPRKRAAQGQEADLGAFEGGQDKFQTEDGKAGWGARPKAPPPGEPRKNDDDDEPKIAKG